MTSRILFLNAAALLCAGGLFSSQASAQRVKTPQEIAMDASTDTSRAKLAPLKWMLGEWSGPAGGTNGGQTYSVTQHEKVIEAAAGTVLMIQGRGVMNGQTAFEAAGMISYDMGSHQYKWISSGGNGYLGISEAQVKGDTLIWTTPGGGGSRTRYTIWKSAKGEWREIGEPSRDNQTWTRTFEMTLVTK